jgi:anti-sigma B factor antagonist
MSETGFPVEVVNGVAIVTTPPEIDITNADELRAAMQQAESVGGGTFVIDMSRTRFCDSAGLHALVDAHLRALAEDGQVLLVATGPAVLRIFEITGVDQVLPRFAGVPEALAHLAAAGSGS